MQPANCSQLTPHMKLLNQPNKASEPKTAKMGEKTVSVDEATVAKIPCSISATRYSVEPSHPKIFKLIRYVGQGASAKILEVLEMEPNSTRCALKVGDLDFIPKNSASISWMQSNVSAEGCSCKQLELHREANIHQKLQHENIVLFLGFGHINEQNPCRKIPAILMELGETSLLAQLKELVLFKENPLAFIDSPLPLAQRCVIFSDVANGLKYMHDKSLAHLDIHPKNILISKGRAKICDFGLTSYYSSQKKQAKYSFGWCVSMTYMAPEAFFTPSKTSTKSDIFTVGVMIKMCVLGTENYHSWYTNEGILKNIHKTPEHLEAPNPEEKVFNTFDVVTVAEIIYQSEDPEYNLATNNKVAASLLEDIAKPCLQLIPSERPDIYQVLALLKQIKDPYLQQMQQEK